MLELAVSLVEHVLLDGAEAREGLASLRAPQTHVALANLEQLFLCKSGSWRPKYTVYASLYPNSVFDFI